jgi:hypothetical protein
MGYIFRPTNGPSSGYHNNEFENIGTKAIGLPPIAYVPIFSNSLLW